MGKQGEQPHMLGNTVTLVKDTRLHHTKLELREEPSKEVHEETHLGRGQELAPEFPHCHRHSPGNTAPHPPPLFSLVTRTHATNRPCANRPFLSQGVPHLSLVPQPF